MKALRLAILLTYALSFCATQAKDKEVKLTNWDEIDIAKYWKIKMNVPGKMGKSLKDVPTFINNYSVFQATTMVGSASSSNNSSLFSGAALGGVSEKALQQLTNELYADWVTKLKAAGLNITEGNEVMNSEYVQSKKDDNKSVVKKGDGVPVYDKVNAMESVNVREHMMMWPEGANIAFNYSTTKSGLFSQNLCKKNDVNIMSVNFTIGFAEFDGDKGYKGKLYLTTKPGLYVRPILSMNSPAGAWGSMTVGEGAIKGNNNWSKGLVELSSKDGSWLGLSSSAKYSLEADESLYIAEVKALITNLQTTMVNMIVAELK